MPRRSDPRSDPKHQEALDRFKLSSDAFAPQRKRALEDMRFYAGEQWPDEIKRARQGSEGSGVSDGLGPPVPARPCLTINKVLQPVQQVENQIRNAKLALKFAPKGSGASREVAEVMGDIARGVQVDSRAHLARIWGVRGALLGGIGAYRIAVEYANDGDWDLDIVYKRIPNQLSVYFDPHALEPDWSDGEWAFITEDLAFDAYKRRYGTSKMADLSEGELTAIGDGPPEWIRSTRDGGKVVRVAEYWYVDHKKVPHVLVGGKDGQPLIGPDGQLVQGPKAQIEADFAPALASGEVVILRERMRDERTVKACVINAMEILEQGDWMGRYIPIIPVIGDEQNLDGERRWYGIVYHAKDAGRSYNVTRSAQVEGAGLVPRAPFILDPRQIEGFETWWKLAAVRNFPYLPARATLDDMPNTLLPMPQRNVVEPAIQALTLLAQQADGDIKATTGIFDPSLGNLSPGDRSGKAILALQKQAELGSSGYLDNLASLSMAYEGKVLRDLIPRVYDRPGRIVATIGEDDQRKSVMVNQPYVEQGGEPQAAAPEAPGAKYFDLAKGEYSVAVTVGKSYTTRREEGAAAMGELISAAPGLLQLVGDLYVSNLDFPGSQQMADRLKKALPPELQDESRKDPQQQLQQMQQQLQQAMQVLQLMKTELDAKTDAIETERTKYEYQAQIKQLEVASRERVDAMKVQADLVKTQAQIQAEAGMEMLRAEIARVQAFIEQVGAERLQAGEQVHQTAERGASEAHEADMAEMQAEQQQAMQAQQQAAQAQNGAGA